MSDDLLLTLLWLLPLAGALVVLLIPRRAVDAVRWTSLGFTAATFVLTLVAYSEYVAEGSKASAPLADRAAYNALDRAETSGAGVVVREPAEGQGDLMLRRPWISAFDIQYFVGLDGISLSLVLLTGLVSLLACLASWTIDKQVKGYFSLFLLLTASMMGVFLALDLFLFYVFFEVLLLPMYFLIAVWGGGNREYSAIKFLLYTLFGSVFVLVAVLILYFYPAPVASPIGDYHARTFDIVRLTQAATGSLYYGRDVQGLIFLLFLTGFCVKLPSFPFHTWLPDAHVDAPTPISMILAGVLLKIGGYGLVRLAWPLAPAGAYDWSYLVAAIGVFSIIYGALVAMAQTDFKKLVAYSSVSHMGFVTLGMAVMRLASESDPRYYAYGVNGAMFMMIAHGITSTGMFFLVGVIYDRAHTRDLRKLGGLLNAMPVYGAASFIIFFGSMGLPGLCGFIAEVFVVLSAFNYSWVLAVLAASAVILTAGYILWTLQRVFLGRTEEWARLPDMNVREVIVAAPLVVLTVALGVLPQTLLLSWMGPSVDRVVQAVTSAQTLQDSRVAMQTQPAAPAVRTAPAPAEAGRGGPDLDRLMQREGERQPKAAGQQHP
jgi:NADH-quinone oxidoreductase subunit M